MDNRGPAKETPEKKTRLNRELVNMMALNQSPNTNLLSEHCHFVAQVALEWLESMKHEDVPGEMDALYTMLRDPLKKVLERDANTPVLCVTQGMTTSIRSVVDTRRNTVTFRAIKAQQLANANQKAKGRKCIMEKNPMLVREFLYPFFLRSSCKTIAKKLRTKEQYAGMDAMKNALASYHCLTVTFDRGGEFALWPVLEEEMGIDCYICDPASPNQKGQVENRIGRLRNFIRSGEHFGGLAQSKLGEWCAIINDRRMEVLNGHKPNEYRHAIMKVYHAQQAKKLKKTPAAQMVIGIFCA